MLHNHRNICIFFIDLYISVDILFKFFRYVTCQLIQSDSGLSNDMEEINVKVDKNTDNIENVAKLMRNLNDKVSNLSNKINDDNDNTEETNSKIDKNLIT